MLRAKRFVHFQQQRLFHTTLVSHAGHNKWSKIKHHKAEQDLKRSQNYAKVAREITTAVRSMCKLLLSMITTNSWWC